MSHLNRLRLPFRGLVQNRHARRVLEHLSRISILRSLPPEEMQAIVPYAQHQTYPAGTRLIEEGAVGDALYLIESGTARVERKGATQSWFVGAGSAVGEAALLRGEVRSASVIAETALTVWRISKSAFDELVCISPNLKQALEGLASRRELGETEAVPSSSVWLSTALRALEVQSHTIKGWQMLMAIGFCGWLLLLLETHRNMLGLKNWPLTLALVQLVVGLLIIQGACEAFVHGIERLGARRRWNGFVSGTIGSALSTLPEFVVIAFLVTVEPLVAFVTTVVTIFNNALAFSVYSFFLPKDKEGCFAMPRSLTQAGGELLISGGAIVLIAGLVMLVMRVEHSSQSLVGLDLILLGVVLLSIYGYYLVTLVRFYGEGMDADGSHPPEPARLGHETSWPAIGSMLGLGLVGAYCGGEAISVFADSALTALGWPMVPTAAALAFFAGISEYIIVYKSHQRGEIGIALSNVFGGLTQVMFLLLPFGLLVIGILGLWTADIRYEVPINAVTIMLMLLLFPLFHTLHQCIENGKSLSNMDALAMTGIYVLLLYFLFTAPI